MRKRSIKDAPWYPMAVALCIAVVFYIILSHIGSVLMGIGTFIRFFRPVIFGCILAYIINPLSKLFKRKVFKRIKTENKSNLLSTTMTFIVVIAFLVFMMIVLIPQLAESAQTFSNNFDEYYESLNIMLNKVSIGGLKLDIKSIVGSSENAMLYVADFIGENMNKILDYSANAGKNIADWLIAFILSIYLLAEKGRIKAGLSRLLKALFSNEKYMKIVSFLRKSDDIFNRYIAFNLIDSLIIGSLNAIFMGVLGMEYTGLVSFVVGITNIIPTIGPIFGAVIGAFVLLMVKPTNALIFIIFTLILQTLDAYIIKPRLFGNSLGVSGLWVLVGIVVGGNMFGIVGILLAIPLIAIIDLIYNTYLLPWLENRRIGI
ncbi:MAG: AI-2E family transporter [Lachnospiraceae bacterium]|nr:AI-2E family transporter [Lachnospiraceae bacterium]